MTLSEFHNEVAKRADTEGVQINVAETKRVLAVFFDLLEDLKPVDDMDIVTKGLKQASKRRR